ncbi:MAG: peptidylprolyl isomerase [Bacteroidetes bacterium]|nr:peptidylprolyl isomerase [Bacteroidota bacterium]MDA1122122.1 peptidylprolyl isomerase [Bacteroidota bacterium]
MKVAMNTVVTLNYTLRSSEGVILDTSAGREPLVYLHGAGGLIAGLERELEGGEKGNHLEAIIQPEDAYGKRRDDLLQVVPKDGFKGKEQMMVGMQVQMDTKHGQQIAFISKIEEKEVTLDMNHPLADMTLYFDIDIVAVRSATEDEIGHGHVHGAGGHHH